MNGTPLYLLLLIVAIASTPLNIFQICAWNCGTENIEPWRSKLTKRPAVRRLRALFSRIREWCAEMTPGPLMSAAMVLLVLAIMMPAHAHGSMLLAGLTAGASNLKPLRAKSAEIHERLKALNEKAAAHVLDASAPALTEAERAEVTTLKGQFESVSELLAEATRLNDAERNMPAANDADADANRRALNVAGLEVGKDELDKKAKAPGFFGRQLHVIRKQALASKGHDEVLTVEDKQILKQMAAATGANTDVPSDGGFLVQPQRAEGILQRTYETGQVLSRVTRLPIGAGSNSMKFPAIDETSRADGSRFGGIASYWLGQGNTISSSKPKFRELELKLRKIGAFVYSTDEMNVDAVAFEAWVNMNLPKELAFRVEDSVFNGLGAAMPQGILQSDALITVTRAGASHVTYDDVAGMWKRMWAGSRGDANDDSKTAWFVDQSVEQDLEQINIAIGTAGVLAPIYKPAGSVPGQKYASLYGRPIIPVEYCAALGTKGDVILASMPEYTVIDKGGVDQAVSLHVAFLTDESVYRFMYRVDGQLSWNAPLTPKSAGSTLSCAIALSTV